MDLTKFIHLITYEYVYFHKVSEFQDKYEGNLTTLDLQTCHSSMSTMILDQRDWFYVSCWHINDVESNAMWNVYGRNGDAIAIQTDFKTLKECLSEMYDDEIELSKVKYIDYNSSKMLDEIFQQGYMRVHDVIDYKHVSYEYERELRAKVWQGYMNKKEHYFAVRQDYDKGFYIKIDVRKLIKRVYISPTSSTMLASCVVKLMNQFKIEAEIHISDL